MHLKTNVGLKKENLMREYKKVSMDRVWNENDRLIMNFGKQLELLTGQDFILELSNFLFKNQYINSFYEDESGNIFPMRVFSSEES